MFKLFKRNRTTEAQDEPIELISATTAREICNNKYEETDIKNWEKAHNSIQYIAKEITKAANKGNNKIEWTAPNSNVARKLEILLNEKGYHAYTRFSSNLIEIAW